MADVPGRDEIERKWARKLGRLLQVMMGRLLEKLGDPPNLDNISPEFWDEAGEELAAALSPLAQRRFLEQAQMMLEDGPLGVEWGIVNERAASWARRYTFDLVSNINQTSRNALREIVAGFFERQQTLGEAQEQIAVLRDQLGNLFGPVRAEMIARTEVTRASVEGERAFVDEIAKQGIRMQEVWQTKNDERVCPICGPRHGQAEGFNWTKNDGPPAHPRCRCWVEHRFMQ